MLWHIFDDAPERTRGKVAGMYAILIAANVAAWLWAWVEFRDNALLLGTAFLAYSFGLRHAFDADHIAAIDNITRKLMQEGRRPIAVGFFFSLGHSSIVIGLVLAIALTTTALQDRFDALKAIGGVIGTSAFRCVSAGDRRRQHRRADPGLPRLASGQARRPAGRG